MLRFGVCVQAPINSTTLGCFSLFMMPTSALNSCSSVKKHVNVLQATFKLFFASYFYTAAAAAVANAVDNAAVAGTAVSIAAAATATAAVNTAAAAIATAAVNTAAVAVDTAAAIVAVAFACCLAGIVYNDFKINWNFASEMHEIVTDQT